MQTVELGLLLQSLAAVKLKGSSAACHKQQSAEHAAAPGSRAPAVHNQGCQGLPELADEQVSTPDALEPPSSFQDGWDESAEHMPLSSAFALMVPCILSFVLVCCIELNLYGSG